MSRKNVVVVGHGMVAHRFVEALRVRDEQNSWSVTVLGEEADAAYDRVGLSSYVGAWDRKELALAGNDYAADDLVDLRVGTRAVGIDRAARTVTTAGGDVLPYDSLVLATGSYPFVPPVPGHDLPGCFVYRTLDDLDGIRAAAERAKAAGLAGIVIGGGLLGLEAANALRLLGVTPHVVEYNNRLMPAQVDEGGGRVLDRLVTDLGLVTHTGVGTEKIEAGSEALQVTLSDGSVLEAGLVIFSAGSSISCCHDHVYFWPASVLTVNSHRSVGTRGGVAAH